MPIPLRTRKPGHQHIRTERPNHPHHVRQRHIVSAPLSKSLLGALRKSKVGHARKTFLHSVILVRRQQLFRPQHSQHVRQIAANFILPALAAIQRHQQHTRAPPTRFQRQHSAIFIIGMRHGLHQPRSRAQPPQHEPQAESAPILRKLGRRSLIGQLRKIRYRGLLIVSNWRRNACTP